MVNISGICSQYLQPQKHIKPFNVKQIANNKKAFALCEVLRSKDKEYSVRHNVLIG